jgi:DNA-directed RNA polymerase subunit K/omega
MSDYEDSDYKNSSSDSEEEVLVKKPLGIKKQTFSKNINNMDDEASDESSDEDEDEQDGGAVDDFNSDEEESKVEGSVDNNDDDDESVIDSDVEDVSIDGELEEAPEQTLDKSAKTKKNASKKNIPLNIDDDDDDDDDENYLQKFDSEITKNYMNEFHPECYVHNYDEIAKLSHVVRDSDGIIVDPLHKTIPYLTKFEKARVLGQRAKQIESGTKPFINVPETIIDGHIIAELELKEKKIPFIIRRPIPGGACEYWHLRDLEMVHF